MASVNFSGIPAVLQSIPHWLLWKNIISTQYPRGKKIPIDCHNLGDGSSANPGTWGTFENAKLVQESHNMSGVGFVLTKESGIFCVDIDKCVIDGTLNQLAIDVLAIFKDKTYVEGSFHQDGIHIFGRGNLPDDEKGGNRGEHDEIEIYDCKRFIAITGYKLKSAHHDLTDCQKELDQLRAMFPKAKNNNDSEPRKARSFNGGTITDKLSLSCSSIGYPVHAVKKSNGIQGAHPVHGSTTGSNFCINESDNTWYCFRHNSGGGALELYAVMNGIIDCGDAGRGCLDGKWTEIFTALRKDGHDLVRAGLEIPESISMIKRRIKAQTRRRITA